jgi:ABC-type lipoprotein release transport system permease subunit
LTGARFHDRLFRLLLRALPAEFRAHYGREMESHFRTERREAVTDAVTYGAVFAAMTICAVLACLLPAQRATRVEPAITLRG